MCQDRLAGKPGRFQHRRAYTAGRCMGVLALALVAGACESRTQLGGGSSMVTGSAGEAGTTGASTQLVRCDRPLGTAALVEPESNTQALLGSVGLQSPIPLIRLMMAQSNCFQVIDRGAALGNIQTEDALSRSGMLRQGSTTARGRMITTQYLITPNVIFSNQNSGGFGGLAALGGLLGAGGAIAGAVAGSMRFQEAQTALFLVDAQSGVQTAVAEGSAKVTDFGGFGGLGGFGGGIAGLGGIGGYGNTAEGKLVAAAFLDSYNNLVHQIRGTQPNLPPVMPGAEAARSDTDLVMDIQAELRRRGYYNGALDGIFGRGTTAAVRAYQRDNNLSQDGQPSLALLQHIRGQ